jgi:Asp-tRNA(Asn)/Glu-tRNA(Gln) amidotransferase A subunit family amidase
MQLLEPGFSIDRVAPATRIGWLTTPPTVRIDESMDSAVSQALRASGCAIEDVTLSCWDDCYRGFGTVIGYEAWQADAHLMGVPGGVHDYVGGRLRQCGEITADAYAQGLQDLATWRDEVLALLAHVPVLALPTLVGPPPEVSAPFLDNSLTCPFNASGTPAVSIPVGSGPGESLQLVAAPGGEELLLATAGIIESAVGVQL